MITYKDWTLRAFKQIHYPPFKPWCAMAERLHNGVRCMFNAEGDTYDDAIKRAKERIDKGDFSLPNGVP